jgi:hypothetical protein
MHFITKFQYVMVPAFIFAIGDVLCPSFILWATEYTGLF